MKKYVFLVLWIMTLTAGAADEKQLFAQANSHYAAQEYDKAAELYQQILNSGKESAELYFNLGNALFKTGDFVNAILNYERAKLLDPRNEDIDFNLKIANQSVVDNMDQLPKPFFSRWWNTLADWGSADQWARWSLLSFILSLTLLGSYLFSRSLRVKKISFFGAASGISILLLTFFLARHQHQKINDRSAAIVRCARVTIKSSPSSTGTDLFLIHEGLKVNITDQLDKWKEVKLSDGNKGWVPDSCLARI